MNFESVIGLEVHVELKTASKIFSPSPNAFGDEPNTNVNPGDLAYPGVLPVLNEESVNYAMEAAMALNCDIATDMKFDRKSYFYPDNPKVYQLSQFEQPIGSNGSIEIEVNGEKKQIGITRLHMEEDAGKLVHQDDGYSLVDFNRAGTPLVEIVSEPDIRSPEEAYAYLEKLKNIIQYTGVSDCKMEEGSLRCDANLSVRPVGQEAFGVKTELKNLNSFSFVQKGLEYEAKRQEQELLSGGEIQSETRRFDEKTKKTVLMRVKEEAEDYRYYPDADIPPLHVDEAWKQRIKDKIPELPDARRQRYIQELELPEYDASVLTASKEMADFFEETVSHGADIKQTSNWMMDEVSAYMNKNDKELDELALTPETLAKMIKLIEDGTISSKIAKKVFAELVENGGDPGKIVQDQGLAQISDEGQLTDIITKVLDENEQSIIDYKNGKDKAIKFLVGQVMKATKGQANPPMVNKILQQEMDKR
ncbi:Asp-tRNA(Asn)/Glu-tRNA(Gln) amidotransferase subunit GatB [Barrientosiimonas marina]|uniref:Aspartyl/glutamyl-tRNA(Asn/Gln) amidotransferase subunit B n=1 Tax=Lentibacillus kimchii TaxID=1542911 RepID=A0ABW2URS6_9BACI